MEILSIILNIISWICMLIGISFCVIGIFGVYKLPDLFTKQHAVGLIDTAGFMFISISLALRSGYSFISLKILFLGILASFLSVPTTNALLKSAIVCKVLPKKFGGKKNNV